MRKYRRLILGCNLCPGDILTLTAAVESLHATYPGEYKTAVRTTAMQLWENNPHVCSLSADFAEVIECHYPSIQQSCQLLYPFLEGYTSHLSEVIGRPLRLTTNRPHVYLTDDEKIWLDMVQQHHAYGKKVPYMCLSAGVKDDYPLKQWPVEYYQEVVKRTAGCITWAQIGSNEHHHEKLDGVIDLRGQTDHRQFARLVYNCSGGVGPPTYLGNMCAAFEKPYVCINGGREPANWMTYPKQQTLHTIGMLSCCRNHACWKSRVLPREMEHNDTGICEQPMVGFSRPVGKCMAMIEPSEVIAIVKRIASNLCQN